MNSPRSNPLGRFNLSSLPAAAALMAMLSGVSGAPLFSDNFDTDSSANWTIQAGYLTVNAGTPGEPPKVNDYTVIWGWDYGSTTYKLFQNDVDYTEQAIPPAPHGGGVSKGLRVSVNKLDDLDQRFAVNLYPKNRTFSGDFALKFDLWMNYAGYGAGDSRVGATEHTLFGINHSGTRMNWQTFNAAFASANTSGSDGLWFAITGDGGSQTDIRSVVGTTNGPGRNLAGAEAGIPDRNADGAADVDSLEPFWSLVAPAGLGEAPGVPGKRWLDVEISQINNVVTWKIDGHVILSRTNGTDYQSGNIMIGLMDIFDSSLSDPREDTYVIFDNLRVVPIRTVTVTTTDNGSPAGDGQTSLFEALNAAQENDTIKFNIPGAGPHYILTPEDGYPLISVDGLRIDGYSQPGSSVNTHTILSPNNAVINIVLDSRTGTHPYAVLDFPGFGPGESAILGVYAARQVDISGLAFLSRYAPTGDDPSIYSIALVSESTHAHLHGNWFGVDPKKTVAGEWNIAGGRAAVASFVDSDKQAAGTYYQGYSWGAIVGTDGDGSGDVGEHNVLVANEIGLSLETPGVKASGNWINVLPDGKLFTGPLDPTFALDGDNKPRSLEAIENGKGDRMLIGTEGDGISDSEERNVIGPVRYDHHRIVEFWRPATNIVFAGNYVGVGLDGKPSHTNDNALIYLSKRSDARVGSNFDGTPASPSIQDSDLTERNLLSGSTRPLFELDGDNFNNEGADASRITLRGNTLIGSPAVYPLGTNDLPRLHAFFSVPLANPDTDFEPSVSPATTTSLLIGRLPEGTALTVKSVTIDLYVSDPVGAADADGKVSPTLSYLGSFLNDSVDDGDPDPRGFAFDIDSLGLSASQLSLLTVTANYFTKDPGQPDNEPYTSFFSPLDFRIKTVTKNANGVTLTWQGGKAPFQVLKRTEVDKGVWQKVGGTTLGQTLTDAVTTTAVFYRVQEAP